MADIELLVEYVEQLKQNWQEALKLLSGRVNNPDLSEVMRALQANLYLTTETCQELKETCQELKAKNEELQRQIEHLSTSGRNLLSKTKKMITDLLFIFYGIGGDVSEASEAAVEKHLKAILSAPDNFIADIANKYAELKSKNEASEQEISDLKERNEELSASVDNFINLCETQIKPGIAAKNEKIAELERELESLRGSLDEQREKAEEIGAQNGALQQQLDEAQEKLDQSAKDLVNMIEINKTMRESLDECVEERRVVERERSLLQSTVNQQRTKIDELTVKNSELQEGYLQITEDYGELQNAYGDLSAEHATLQAEYDSAAKLCRETFANLSDLQTEHSKLQTEYDTLYNSSWQRGREKLREAQERARNGEHRTYTKHKDSYDEKYGQMVRVMYAAHGLSHKRISEQTKLAQDTVARLIKKGGLTSTDRGQWCEYNGELVRRSEVSPEYLESYLKKITPQKPGPKRAPEPPRKVGRPRIHPLPPEGTTPKKPGRGRPRKNAPEMPSMETNTLQGVNINLPEQITIDELVAPENDKNVEGT